MLLGSWLLIGLFIDGWAHNNLDASLETFFTPWHGVFYSGFTACAGWLSWVSFGPAARGRGREVIPLGYGLGLVGLVVFAIGGAGDLLWHMAFGIETDIDALFSPTHLLLFGGILLVLGSPFRAAWAGDPIDAAPTLRQFAPVIASLTLMASLVAFFFMYWSLFTNASPLASVVAEAAGAGEYAEWLDYFLVIDGVASALMTSIIMIVPLLLAIRRWRVPVGTATILFTAVAILSSALIAFALWFTIPAGLIAGLSADWVIHRARPSAARLGAVRVLAGVAPAVLVAGWFASLHLAGGVGYLTEVWAGTIVWCSLAGIGVSWLILPGPTSHADSRMSSGSDEGPATAPTG